PIFLMWFGPTPMLFVGSWELGKQVLGDKLGNFGKPLRNLIMKEVLGDGLAVLNGEKWAHHRRIINPSFHIDKLKDMVSSMVESTANMLKGWEKVVRSGYENEVDVSQEFNVLSSDIIARTAFGSNYLQGKHIFDLLAQVTSIACKDNTKLMVPGYRYLPLKRNRDRWRMHREIKNSMKQLILNREKTATNTNDLLGSMMNTVHELRNRENNVGLTTEEIIEECKTFFFAGQETTRNFMTYVSVLLAIHPEWQEQARAEVLQVCGNHHPTFESQSKLKILGMILNEVIRLYPPAVALLREAHKDTILGDLSIPAGTQVIFPLLALNHNIALWGEDASEFKPERFSQGLANAVKDDSVLFIPFGYGLRTCVGQNFAMLEAKIAIAMILQRFSFVLSPAYVHAPTAFITLYPQHGVQIILHELHRDG
ncbi:hypothetical protein KI387_035758, partial [Taxus chinensis]